MEKALDILKLFQSDKYKFESGAPLWKPELDSKMKEAIAELEALQSSSCDTCEYDGTFRYMGKDSKCTRCCNFFSSRYVRKGERDD